MNAQKESIDWDALSKLENLRPVIDPHDAKGSKNYLIDLIHWNVLRTHLLGSKNVLDFGCGIGRFAKRINALGINYIGIDPSLGMIQKAIDFNGSKYFKHFDGFKIPFSSEAFDTVIVSEVLIYILKTPAGSLALSEIHRVLKSEGCLLMIEQASISGRKSESASDILTENDYVQALSAFFEVKNSYKVRSPDFSAMACRIIESPKVPLSVFRYIAGILANYEAGLVAKAPEAYFKTTSYYDFLIQARAIKSNSNQ